MDGSERIPSGELQTETLRVLQKLGKGSAADIMKVLSEHRKIAYTTVKTVLDRLYERGVVKRSKAPSRGGMKYIYSPATNAYVRSNIVPNALNSLLKAFGPSVVSAIYEGLENINRQQEGGQAKKASRPRKNKT